MSRNATVPHGKAPLDWKELGSSLATDLADYAFDGPLDAISAYEHSYGRVALVTKVSSLLRTQDALPGAAHAAFAELSFERVVTTNFDFLLETAYAAAGRPCLPLLEEVQLSAVNQYAGPSLLKLHGDVHHPERMIITEDDYDNFISRHPLLATHLAANLIEQTAVLIGYSLDDPDMRQILALVRDRLGRLARPLWCIQVDAPAHVISRYARRGVHVINLPKSRSQTYDEVLAKFFLELGHYWRSEVLVESQSTEDRTLAELRLPTESSRTCYFAVPLDLISWYRDTLFPVIEGAGLVPVFAQDVVTKGETLMAKREALIERAQLVVVDVASPAFALEARLALRSKPAQNVLLVGSSSGRPVPSEFDGALYVQRPIEYADASDSDLPEIVEQWLRAAMGPVRRRDNEEAQRLLEAREYRSALISAMSALEQHLAASAREHPNERRPPTLGRMLHDLRGDGVVPSDLYDRLIKGLKLRNAALHEGRDISASQARDAVTAVGRVMSIVGLPPSSFYAAAEDASHPYAGSNDSSFSAPGDDLSYEWTVDELRELSTAPSAAVRTAVVTLDVLAEQPERWLSTSDLVKATGIPKASLKASPAGLNRYIKSRHPGHQSPIRSEWGLRIGRGPETHYSVTHELARKWSIARST